MFAGKKSAQIREILISESAWEEMTCLFAPSLADRASITGQFSDAECRKLDVAFPYFIRQMESMLTTGELNPRHTHCVTLYRNGFTCEADTLGSCGYVYIAIYPTQR